MHCTAVASRQAPAAQTLRSKADVDPDEEVSPSGHATHCNASRQLPAAHSEAEDALRSILLPVTGDGYPVLGFQWLLKIQNPRL